ncbi:MAG: magnesium transporter [Cellvibrionaceae bacterium]|jgi:magnesium transporter
MKLFRKKYHPPGTAPGTLVEAQKQAQAKPLKIDMINFNATKIDYFRALEASECKEHLDNKMTTWIHVSGALDFASMKQLGDLFSLHPLAMEDVLNHGQRSKVETYDKQLFVIVNLPVIIDHSLHIEQVSLFCGEGYLLSFHEQLDDNTYDILHKRLQKNINGIRNQSSDHLLYVLIDLVTDNGFPILDVFGERIETIEESLTANNSRAILQQIHKVKRELTLLRRALWPQREVINSLMRDENGSFNEENKIYLRDCYDHTIQIIELIESYRDMASSTLEVCLSANSYRLNEVMRFLTVISTLFIPPTFIVGVYGMNFKTEASSWNMPELAWPFGYLTIWLVMLGMALCLLYFFKRKGWL